MRVGINATILDDRPSGLGNFTRQVINHMAPLLDDYVVFASCFEGLGIPAGNLYRVSQAVSPSLGRRGHLARWSWLQFALPGIMRKEHVDLLLSTVPEGVVSRGVKQVIVVHDLSPLVFPDIYPRLHHYFRFVVPRLLRDATHVVCDSEFTRNEVSRCYGIGANKMKVVYAASCLSGKPSSDPNRVKYRYGLEDFMLCVASELSPRKRIPYVLEALASFLRRPETPALVIVGKKDPRALPKLDAIIRKEQIAHKVHLLGYVPDGDLPDLYASARLLLYSSIYEGFGLPILDAMACGTPVVTFNASCLPEIAADAAATVPPDDPENLVLTIEKVLSEPSYAMTLVKRGFERVKDFSWKKSARHLIEIISALR